MSRVEDELVVECALDCKQERNRPKREVKGGERIHPVFLSHASWEEVWSVSLLEFRFL